MSIYYSQAGLLIQFEIPDNQLLFCPQITEINNKKVFQISLFIKGKRVIRKGGQKNVSMCTQ